MKSDDRVDDECPDVEALAHDLAMDLALRRDVDEDVATDLGRARQTAVRSKSFFVAIGRFERGERRQVVRLRDDPMLGKLAKALRHLAAAADPASATDRVDVDAERTCRVQDRRPFREPATAPGRSEDDERV